MDPLTVAARFAAFTCYLNREKAERPTPEEAAVYARSNWKRFLPYVNEDLGKLLTEPRPSIDKRFRQHRPESWRTAAKDLSALDCSRARTTARPSFPEHG